MARVNEVPPDGRATRRDGRFVTTKIRGGIAIVRSWPRKRGAPDDPDMKQLNRDYAAAQRHSVRPISEEHLAAFTYTQNTIWNWREFIVKAAYGTLARVQFPDGIVIADFLTMKNEIQAWLDTLSMTPGAVVYRAGDEWRSLEPGGDNSVLTMEGGFPQWAASQGGGGGGSGGWYYWNPSGSDTTPSATHAISINPVIDFDVERIAFSMTGAVGSTFDLSVVEVTSGRQITAIDFHTALNLHPNGVHQWYVIDLGSKVHFTAGNRYAICLTRTDGTVTSPVNIDYVTQVAAPMPNNDVFQGWVLNSKAPAVGDTFTVTGSGQFCIFPEVL